jgi:GT2 family glycosyltransferase
MKEITVFTHKNDSNKLLTIAIPTYNREKKLVNQLKSIFFQSEYKDVEIVILDNHSNYDIANCLKNHFSFQELSNVELIKNPFNIGVYGNVANSFMFCRTKYMWLLSDDDETLCDSIKNVLLNIEKNKDIAIFKYSIYNFVPEEDKIICNITEFIDYYKSGIHSSGNMIFISNNIFNMELLIPFIQNAFTVFNYLFLIISSLSSNTIKMKFCPQCIVNYIPPNHDSEWDFISTLLMFSTFNKFSMAIFYKNNYTVTKKQIIELSTLIIRDFPRKKLLLDLFKINNPRKRGYIYNKLFFDVFIYDTGHHWIYFFLFHFLNLVNISYANLSKIINKLEDILTKYRLRKPA